MDNDEIKTMIEGAIEMIKTGDYNEAIEQLRTVVAEIDGKLLAI